MLNNTKIQKFIYLISIFFLGFILVTNFISLFFKILPTFFCSFLNIVGLFVCILLFILIIKLAFFIFKRLSLFTKKPLFISIIIFSISLIFKLIFVIFINTQQYSDFKMFYWVTVDIAKHSVNYLSQHYFSIWAYQTGFPATMSLFIKIFGTSIFSLIFINCIFLSIINVYIYLILRKFIDDKTSIICAFIYLFLPFIFGLSSVYTNQHLANLFFYTGIYILLYNKEFTVHKSIIASVFFVLGNMVRPEAITIILSIIGLCFLLLINTNKKKLIIPMLVSIAIFCIGNSITSQIFISSGLNPNGLHNNFPLYKFIVGLNHETGGSYSKSDDNYFFQSQKFIENVELRNDESLTIIKNRLFVSPIKLGILFGKKIRAMWSSDPFWYPSFNNIDINTNLNVFVLKINTKILLYMFAFIDIIFNIFIYTNCLVTMVISLKRKENSINLLFLTILFLIVFIVYLFIEVSHRYSYFIMPTLLILSAPGFNYTKSLYLNRRKKKPIIVE